jgi:hypothetical protein
MNRRTCDEDLHESLCTVPDSCYNILSRVTTAGRVNMDPGSILKHPHIDSFQPIIMETAPITEEKAESAMTIPLWKRLFVRL